MNCRRLWSVLLVALALSPTAAGAVTIVVGPDQKVKLPSEAARIAKDGDTIEIEPVKDGYLDCASWPQSNLTIEGKGSNVVITDTTCAGKGLFVIDGNNVTIRNLTFARARVPDHNGAGIRAEGNNLTIEDSRFLDNQDGILSNNGLTGSTIVIKHSEFDGNGSCDGGCAHGIYINEVALLRIEDSVFKNTHHAHQIKSRAQETILTGNTIEDGQNGNSSYLVDIPSGGSLIMRQNVLEKGPNAENHKTAIAIGEEGVKNRTKEITIEGNKFTNDMQNPTDFIWNLTATPAVLKNNTLIGAVTPVEGDGSVNGKSGT
jgi:hypothetical protein